MYLDHFGLHEPPFRITPHTDFFFEEADRGATLAALEYAVLHDEGIVKVSGEVGSGKTMLCRVLMERLPAHVVIVYLSNPSLSREEILHTIAEDLSLKFSEGRIPVALRELQEHLIRMYGDGKRVVILIDEAHAMPDETLEQVRLLSNLESNRHKLLQIVLFGQPELDEALAKISMRQLKDRITHSFRMRPLVTEEVARYLSFRMRAAGYRGPDVFNGQAAKLIARAASGLTRRVNILADKALLAAFAEGVHGVTPRQVRAAIRDSEFSKASQRNWTRALLSATFVLLAGLIAGLVLHLLSNSSPSTEARAPNGAPKAQATPQNENSVAPTQKSSSMAETGAVQSSPASSPPASTPTEPPRETVPVEMKTGLLGPEGELRFRTFSTGSSQLLKRQVLATRQRLDTVPDSYLSIELYSTANSEPARLERFLLRAKELVPLDEVLVMPLVSGSKSRVRIAFGVFPDQKSAEEGIERLPPKYKQAFVPELKSFAQLRAGQ